MYSMSQEPPFFYPGGEYLDEKWTLIQKFIIQISEGNLNLQLPENMGEDHLDSVLLALKMMSETLLEHENQLQSSGAIASMNKALLYVSKEGLLRKYNQEAEGLSDLLLETGVHITKVLHQPDFMTAWKENCEGSHSRDYWTLRVLVPQPMLLQVQRMKANWAKGYGGYLLSIVKEE